MLLRPNPSSGVPIYLQLMEQVNHSIETGALRPGEQLPGIRPLAEELVINPNTVAKAYHELEREGVVTKRHGSGTYVSDNGSPLARRERTRILTQRIDALLAEARHMDVPLKDVIDLIRDRHDNLQPKEGK